MFRRLVSGVVLLALLPVPAVATDLQLPSWKLEQVNGQTMACYGFEEAKQLRLMQNDCLTLSVQVDELRKTNDALQKAVVLFKQSETSLQAANNQLHKDLQRAQTERDKETKTAIKAKSNSVLGGGFVWVLVGVAVGALAGGYVGYRLAK